MEVIIYGLGSGRLRIERYLKKEHQIVGYSDSFFEGEFFNKTKFYKPGELLEAKFDYIILAVGEESIRKIITINLTEQGIDSSKIFDFYKIYFDVYLANLPSKTLDKLMQNTDESFDGIILGISHGEVGINPKYLKGSFCNMAIASQDLFYNYKQLEMLVKKYKGRIKELKYAIIDMYKYVYFNYDVTLTKNAIKYCLDSNFNLNNEEKTDLKINANKHLNKYLINQIGLFNKLIKTDAVNVDEDYKEVGYIDNLSFNFPAEETRNKVLDERIIKNYENEPIKASGIQKNIFVDTEKNNINNFSNILKLLKEINNDIKIYIVLIPQFKSVEDKDKIIEKDWKIRFYNTLEKFQDQYKLRILDFKNYEEISSKREYYYDLCHLNYIGATVFTKLLDSYIGY